MFEVSALGIFSIIIGWGYQPERISAGTTLLIYTSLASLPILGACLLIKSRLKIADFWALTSLASHEGTWYSVGGGGLLGLSVTLAFLVKFPVYFVHLWLPKAHVEASAGGSILLAGVLLKIGGYGLYRFSSLVPAASSVCMLRWALWGSAGISLLCIRQKDLKVLIAYSSVAHIGAVIGCLFTKTTFAVFRGMLIMVAHGVSSSIMFFIAGLLYNVSQSRQIILNSGILSTSPIFRAFWLAGCLGNIGVPPTVNFWSELRRLLALINTHLQAVFPFGVVLIASVAYSITLYGSTQSGQIRSTKRERINLRQRENRVLMGHVVLLFLLTPVFRRAL